MNEEHIDGFKKRIGTGEKNRRILKKKFRKIDRDAEKAVSEFEATVSKTVIKKKAGWQGTVQEKKKEKSYA